MSDALAGAIADDIAEVVVCLGVVGVELDGAAALGDGVVEVALHFEGGILLIIEGIAEVTVGLGVVGSKLDGLFTLSDGGVVVALSVGSAFAFKSDGVAE